MSSPRPLCPSCRTDMQPGFVIDLNTAIAPIVPTPEWVEGEAARRTVLGVSLGIDLRARERRPISSFRCPRCGLLQEFAHGGSG